MIRTLLRITLVAPLLAVGLGASSWVAQVGPDVPLCAHAATAHRAGLVIEHGDGRVLRRCVALGSATITALAVLQAGGVEVGAVPEGVLGTAVCQIDNEPPSYPPSCFTPSGSYWVLFLSRGGGAWTTSNLGVSSATVSGGDAVGFRFDPQAGADPPPASPAGTCPTATPPPKVTPTAVAVRPTQAPTTTSASRRMATPGTPTPVATPTSGVLGVVSPATPAPGLPIASGPRQLATVNIGVLLAAIGAGGLVGLLGMQALRRRGR